MQGTIAMALMVLLMGSPATALDTTGGGLLYDVDFDESTVTIREHVFRVTPRSELRDAANEPVTLLDLERELGEWVFYKSYDRGDPPALDVLQISPADAVVEE